VALEQSVHPGLHKLQALLARYLPVEHEVHTVALLQAVHPVGH